MIEQKREYYRVEYPINDRPVLLSRDKKFEVIDISEGGVKFRVDNNGCFLVGDVLGVSIRFSDNYIFNCMGKIVRVDNENVAVNNLHHIPLERIRSEHLQLIQKYHVKH
ncbi:MAG: PilZ domain-containing protein [Gammaproteobacteria bacterium]|nr:PilZ domain-containing protein [Gammaproteobacteria bacterium]